MWTLSFAIFAALKWMSWWRARGYAVHQPGRSLAYLFAWPSMDAEAFLNPTPLQKRPGLQPWVWASLKTALGVMLLWMIARRVPTELPIVRGWAGLLGLVLLLHFGSFHLIALFWQTRGIEALPIMSSPIVSKSLTEFWGKRWNLGFRQLANDFIFRPLHRRIGASSAGLLVFIVSGLIHDLVISLPAGGGYGLPTAYFVLQGLGVTFERSAMYRRLGMQTPLRSRVFTFVVAATPAFWLFHPPFLHRVILPFMQAIHAL